MIFGPIACFRRLESRFSGQNGPRSSEMRVYIEITGHIKNHQNFKILFWSRESEKPIFTIFPEILLEKIWNTGISSETMIPGISSEPTETRMFIRVEADEQEEILGVRPPWPFHFSSCSVGPLIQSDSQLGLRREQGCFVGSLEIPGFPSAHSRFPYSRFFRKKIICLS